MRQHNGTRRDLTDSGTISLALSSFCEQRLLSDGLTIRSKLRHFLTIVSRLHHHFDTLCLCELKALSPKAEGVI
jgi:hypothetical protein